MNELYWITRLDGIHNASIVGLIIFIICAILSFGAYLDNENGCLKLIKIFSALTILCLNVALFVPTTKEGLIIYGIGGTIDYIKSNDKAKQLPDKIVNVLDKYLNEYLDEDLNEQTE